MAVQGCAKCIKYMLFFFNVVFWLAGCVILGVSLWLRLDEKVDALLVLGYEDSKVPDTFYVSVYILIAVGAVMMIVGFVGCYGAIKESRCLLGTFFGCLVALFACEIAAGICGFIHKKQISKDVIGFYDAVYNLGDQASAGERKDAAAAVLKVFHESLQCCGRGGSPPALSDWVTGLCPKTDGLTVAADCHTKITELFDRKLYVVGIAALLVAAVMIFEMIFSMVLCRKIQKERPAD